MTSKPDIPRLHPEIAGPVTRADLLDWLDDVAAGVLASDIFSQMGIPDAARALADAHIALVLSGMRSALARWHPIPAVDDPSEAQALYVLLGELVAARITDTLASLQTIADTSTTRTQKALMQWNREREIYDERQLERAAKQAFAEPKPEDFDHMERIDAGDGRFSYRYRIKPTKE